MEKFQYIEKKQEKRENKRKDKRSIKAEEVIFIFEKFLEGWKTIRIFNTIIQQDPLSLVNKKKVEIISSGNCKIYERELTEERYQHYCQLREKVYAYWDSKKINKNDSTLPEINEEKVL